jgi:hypothetical protein
MCEGGRGGPLTLRRPTRCEQVTHTFSTPTEPSEAAVQQSYLLAIAITSLSLAVLCAAASWMLASRVTRLESQRPPSESALATLAADQAECFSALEKVTTTVKRLANRKGMQDAREAKSHAPPPPGASKAEVRAYYGLTRDGPEFARKQMSLVPSAKE